MAVKKMGKKVVKKARPATRANKTRPAQTKWNGISSDAVQKATGKPWTDWIKLLYKDGAAKLPHKEIATHIRAKYGVGDWWCQMVTVGYEQARGLRVKHQTATGYVANLSKTLPVTMVAAFRAITDDKQRAKWLKEPLTITKATPHKSVRIAWEDGSRVAVGLWDKTGKSGEAKTQVVFQHEKLKTVAAVKSSKAFWAKAADRLAKTLS